MQWLPPAATCSCLQPVRVHAVDDAGTTEGQRRRVPRRLQAAARRLDADHGDVVVQEGMEEADRVAAAAGAGDQQVGQAAVLRQHLLARLAADDGLERRAP